MRLIRYLSRLKKPKLLIRRVKGKSMEPYLRDRSLILATNLLRVRAGSVVIFKHQGLFKIKQVSMIKEDRIFVIGINRAESTDSRDFGWINSKSILATVFYPINKNIN